jgi:predicted RNase H-like HicB family nuclease
VTRRYLADVVGLPVHAQGLTEEEAVRNAKEAIAVHLKALESLAVGRGANTRVVTVKA